MPTKKRSTSKQAKPAPERTKSVVSTRSVLVFHEKAQCLYFVVDDDEDLFGAALTVLRGRLWSDWYVCPPDRPEDLDYSEKDVEKMPPSFRAQALEGLRRHQAESLFWKSSTDMWERINEACSSGDGRLAWPILQERSGEEFERVSLEAANPEYGWRPRDPEAS